MRRNGIANVFGGLFIADAGFVAQRDITNIRVELVRVGIAIPVGFIGTDGMFIPFTGEHTPPANSFKAMANAADTGKEIDKAKGIIWMRSRRTRQQILQIAELTVAQAVPALSLISSRLSIAGLQWLSPWATSWFASVLASYISSS